MLLEQYTFYYFKNIFVVDFLPEQVPRSPQWKLRHWFL